MSKTKAGLLGVLVLALIALGIVYSARYKKAEPVVDAPIVEAPATDVAENSETPSKSTSTPAAVKSSVVGQWQWESTIFSSTNPTTGSSNPVTPAAGKFVATFRADKTFSSTTDCNSLMGRYVVDQEILSIGPIASTKMACAGTTLESEYAKQLGRATSHTISGNELRINLLKDTGMMIFTRSVPSVSPTPGTSLDGNSFRLVSFTANGTTTAVAPTSSYTLSFKGNTLSAKFCNGIGGNYSVSGNIIKATQLISTLMYCSEGNVMTMESSFGAMLSAGATAVQQGDTLILTGSKGEKFIYSIVKA